MKEPEFSLFRMALPEKFLFHRVSCDQSSQMLGIRNKTSLMFLTVVLVATFGTGLLVLWRSKLIVEAEGLEKLKYQTESLANTFDQERLKLRYYTDSIESFLLSIYPDEGINAGNINAFIKQTRDFLESMAGTISPFSLWLVLAPEIPAETHNLALYDRNGDGIYTQAPTYNLNNIEMTNPDMQWFTKAVEDGETWTDPYYWERWDMDLITYSRALKVGDQLIGCIGSDFNFSQKRKEWADTRIYETGYIYLLSEDYDFIHHPLYTGENIKDMLKDSSLSSIVTTLEKTPKGHLYYELDGEKRVTSFVTLSNGWKLCVTTPEAQMVAGFRKLEWELLIIIVVVTLLSIVISSAFSHTITAPIHRLVSSLDNARKGHLQTRVEIRSNDEFQQLAEQFNYFMSELESSLEALHQKEIDLINAKDLAEHSDRLKTSFLANLSHEIRTPLNGIIGNSEFLLDNDFTEEERREFVKVIESSIQRLLKYIEATLLFARLEQHQVNPDLQEYPIEWLQDDLSLVFEKLSDSQQNQLQTIITGRKNSNEDTTIKNDPQLLRKVVVNIGENAFKFTREGQVELEFTLDHSNWGFEIRDTGIGIAPASQTLVFDKFFKDESHRDVLYDGLGLGLSISWELVHLLGGTIQFTSELGKGSVFRVTFPISKKDGQNSTNNNIPTAGEQS